MPIIKDYLSCLSDPNQHLKWKKEPSGAQNAKFSYEYNGSRRIVNLQSMHRFDPSTEDDTIQEHSIGSDLDSQYMRFLRISDYTEWGRRLYPSIRAFGEDINFFITQEVYNYIAVMETHPSGAIRYLRIPEEKNPQKEINFQLVAVNPGETLKPNLLLDYAPDRPHISLNYTLDGELTDVTWKPYAQEKINKLFQEDDLSSLQIPLEKDVLFHFDPINSKCVAFKQDCIRIRWSLEKLSYDALIPYQIPASQLIAICRDIPGDLQQLNEEALASQLPKLLLVNATLLENFLANHYSMYNE
jgi:hypothetical protein